MCTISDKTISLDQTTRVHGPIPVSEQKVTWHELSRPQVHGYDCLGVAFLDNLKFVSIADEKVARVFEAPQRFVSTLETLQVCHFEGTVRLFTVSRLEFLLTAWPGSASSWCKCSSPWAVK